MNSSENQPPPKSKAEALFIVFIVVLVGAFTGWLLCAMKLTVGPYPTGRGLYYTYFAYFFLTVTLLHLVFFYSNHIAKHRTGKTLSKNLPKYIEYAYATLLTIGLGQVFFMPTQFAAFISLVAGSEEKIANQIVKQAQTHLVQDCPKSGQYFTAEYCRKLQGIVSAPSPIKYINDVVLIDQAFLHHVIGRKMQPAPPGAVLVDMMSPILRYADEFRALQEYGAVSTPKESGSAFTWLALVLLPLGIGLRVLKTSMELFGELQ